MQEYNISARVLLNLLNLLQNFSDIKNAQDKISLFLKFKNT